MNAFFSTPERIARLQAVADGWEGTPFMPNAAVRGAGVSCQKLAGRIYIETGFWPETSTIPEGPMDWSHAHTRSLIAGFLATRPEFAVLGGQAAIQPGDLLGFKLGGCVHHCGIAVAAGGRFIHCLRGRGAQYSNLGDATYLSRLGNVWRPIQLGAT
jgi:cell wall-associated NlpC family hydrolase